MRCSFHTTLLQQNCTDLRKVALAIADEQAGLAAAAVANHDNFFRVGGSFGHCGARRFSAGRAAHHGADRSVA